LALLKTIGHSLKNLGPSQKTLRHPWCPKLVTGLIGHSLKLCAPLRKFFAPPGVPSWWRAWAKPSDGLAFWRTVVMWQLILRCLQTSCLKRNADWILTP